MGILRIMLALAVVVNHMGMGGIGIHWFGQTYKISHILDPETAVCIFFGISGFYMALIMKKYHLDQKTSWHHIKNFYFSRAARIYPLYYLAFLLILLTHNWFYAVGNLSGFSKILIIFSNLFIIGHDILRSFYISSTSSTPILNGKLLSGELFPLYTAWTLSQELFFYLLIPFIVRRGMLVVLLLIVLSFTYEYSDYQILAAYFSSILGHLYLFLLGSFLYVFVYEKIQDMNPKILQIIAWISMVLYIIVFFDESILTQFIFFNHELILTCLIMMPIPFVFQYFKKKKWDGFIGLFSYPIYLLHVPILVLLGTKYLSWLWLPMRNSLPFFTAGAVFLIFIILICIPVVLFFEIPIDRLRHRLFSK